MKTRKCVDKLDTQESFNSTIAHTLLDIIASKVDSWVEHSSFKIERCRPPLCQARALVSPQFKLEIIWFIK